MEEWSRGRSLIDLSAFGINSALIRRTQTRDSEKLCDHLGRALKAAVRPGVQDLDTLSESADIGIRDTAKYYIETTLERLPAALGTASLLKDHEVEHLLLLECEMLNHKIEVVRVTLESLGHAFTECQQLSRHARDILQTISLDRVPFEWDAEASERGQPLGRWTDHLLKAYIQLASLSKDPSSLSAVGEGP